jgi:hypothetical protein
LGIAAFVKPKNPRFKRQINNFFIALATRAASFHDGGARIGSKESKSPISLSFTATPLIDFIGIAAIG